MGSEFFGVLPSTVVSRPVSSWLVFGIRFTTCTTGEIPTFLPRWASRGHRETIFEQVESPALILLLINVFLLIVGCFIEANAALITLTPILYPIIVKAGIDPVHFGVVMVLNLMIGLITPPVGMSMYILCNITKVTTVQFSREIWPFVIALVIVLFVVTYVPALVLFVPDLVMGK